LTKTLLIAFLGALGGAALLTPFSIWLARRAGVLDPPDPRKVHAVPMPRWGGMGLFGGTLAGVLLLFLLDPSFNALLDFSHKILENGDIVGSLSLRRQLAGVLVAAGVAWFLGTVDDKRNLPPLVKLLAQIIAAYVAMVYGVRMAGVALPGMGFVNLPIWLSQVATFLWLLGFMNAVNLADGLDGLAAGLAAIAAGTFLVVCVLQGDTEVVFYARQMKLAAVLSAALCGACLGFLFYNFNPARVFMGDGGALFLGFMLGAVSLIGTLKTSAVIALVLPVLVVALPVTDTAFALFRRWRRGGGLMEADRGHFHHRFLAWGWTPRETTLLVYVITLLLSLFTILLTLFKGKV
jgi:UDP-GlcNAc:undecaprenyl-phosphate GlcNAc-1-phosphate transferase